MSTVECDLYGAVLALERGGIDRALELRRQVDAERREELVAVLRPRRGRRSTASVTGDAPSAASLEHMLAELWNDPSALGCMGGATYAVVRSREVSGQLRAATTRARDFAAAHLRIEGPRVYSYAAARPLEHRPTFRRMPAHGFAALQMGAIAVRCDIDVEIAVEVAAHEVFHVARPDRSEKEALAYGEWAASVLFDRGRLVGVHRCAANERAGDIAADHGDVLVVAGSGGRASVHRQWGGRSASAWAPHWRACPVEV